MIEIQCRTCLVISDLGSSFRISEERLLGRTVNEIIRLFIPEMINSSLLSDIICCNCYSILKTFAIFIERCIEVENILKNVGSGIAVRFEQEHNGANRRLILLRTPGVIPIGNLCNNIQKGKQQQSEPTTGQVQTQNITAYIPTDVDKDVSNIESVRKTNNEKDIRPQEFVSSTISISSDDNQSTSEIVSVEDIHETEGPDPQFGSSSHLSEHTYSRNISQTPSKVPSVGKSQETKAVETPAIQVDTVGLCEVCKAPLCINDASNLTTRRCRSCLLMMKDSTMLESCNNGATTVTTNDKLKVKVLNSLDNYQMRPHDRAISIPRPTNAFSQFSNDLLKNGIDVLHNDSQKTEKKRILLFGSLIIRCPECTNLFYNRKAFKVHYKKVHKIKTPIDSEETEKQFFDKVIKANKVKETIQHVCPFCNKNISSKKILRQHIHRMHTKDWVPYKCEKCTKCFRTHTTYKKHVALSKKFNTCAFRKCQFCSEVLLKENRIEHMKLHREFICEECGERLTTVLNLERHQAKHQVKKKDPHLCPMCGKLFALSTNLSAHIKAVHEKSTQRNYMCDKCPKAYFTKARLRVHIMSVHDKRRFECPDCKKSLSTQAALRFHQKLKHLKICSHSCPLCGAQFVRGDYYKRHMMTHLVNGRRGGRRVYAPNNSNPIRCKYCLKLFDNVYKLRAHVLHHVSTMRYKCKFCDATFANITNRYRHQKRHNDPNFNLSCKICWKRMRTKEELDEHQMKHYMRRKYKCELCDEYVSSKYHLRCHWTEKHITPEEVENEKALILQYALEDFMLKDD